MKLGEVIADDWFSGVMDTVRDEFADNEARLAEILDMDISQITNGLVEDLEKLRNVETEARKERRPVEVVESELHNRVAAGFFDLGDL